jgi:serine/threonine-protein kinase RsbW
MPLPGPSDLAAPGRWAHIAHGRPSRFGMEKFGVRRSLASRKGIRSTKQEVSGVVKVLAPFEKANMRNPERNGCTEIIIPSDPVRARQVQEDVEQALKANEYEEKEVFGIKLALEEAMVNAIKHGNQLDLNKRVHIKYHVSRDRFEIHIKDEGPGFNPEEVPDPMAPENLERECGRGLLLMRHYMTEVEYHPPGNAVSMVRVRTDG